MRAILGCRSATRGRSATAAMLNFIGTHARSASMLRLPGVHFHNYGKEPRPGRKLGHCTMVRLQRSANASPALCGSCERRLRRT